MLTILNNQNTNPFILNFLYHFDRLTRCDEILFWMIKNRIIGKYFHESIILEKWTPLALAQAIIQKIDKENEKKPIIAGRDYILN